MDLKEIALLDPKAWGDNQIGIYHYGSKEPLWSAIFHADTDQEGDDRNADHLMHKQHEKELNWENHAEIFFNE